MGSLAIVHTYAKAERRVHVTRAWLATAASCTNANKLLFVGVHSVES